MSVSEHERLQRAALSRLIEPGDVRFTALVQELGVARVHESLLAGGGSELADEVATRLRSLDPARELDQAARVGVRFVVPGDDEWPTQLTSLAGAGALHERGGVPVGLWVRGPARLDQLEHGVAVVGARAATDYGGTVAAEIAGYSGSQGVPVVSGGAFGIDACAHRGAVAAGGLTVAVLACGADKVYPSGNRELLAHIAAAGAVVSEAAPGCAPQRIRFLARNRIIAALTRGTVVVEAAARSGALNTSNWAVRLNRVAMGVPGPVTSTLSVGVHERIRLGELSLVTCGADVLELVGDSGRHLVETRRGADQPRDRLSSRQRQVLDAVPSVTPAPADSIARVAGMSLLEVRGTLDRLLQAGLVDSAEHGWRLTALARS